MSEKPHSIFRAEAVRRYTQSQEAAVLPRFVAPHTQLYLWSLFGLLVLGAFTAWFARVPVYASGSAVAVAGQRLALGSDELILVAFLPARNHAQLRAGQLLFLQFDQAGERLPRPIVAVEPAITSPDAARRRFGLGGDLAAISQPAAVVIAPLEPVPAGTPAGRYAGGVYRVDVEVGSRRVLALLPLIGQFFGE